MLERIRYSNALQAPAPAIDWLDLFGLGFSLIPVRVRGKVPAIRWAHRQNFRASPDEIAIWEREGHNAGIVTGAISGIVVLDCDTPEAIADAEALGIPAGTLSVKTAKGRHYYFCYPGLRVSNKVRLRPGMDLRGDGGFVVAPGSIHPTGVRYEWINHPTWSELAPLPEWILATLRNPPDEKRQATNTIGATPYGQRAVENELVILRNAPIGRRNDQLNRSAFNLAQLFARGHISAGEAKAGLHDVALSAGLELFEIEATIESGWRAGLRDPRGPRQLDAVTGLGPTIISAMSLWKMHFPPLRWAIPGHLPEGLALLAGRPKYGKSFFALQMAVAVATGDGKAFGVPEITVSDVLVCALEDSPRRLKDRLARIYPFGQAPERLHFATNWPRIGQGCIEQLDAWCDENPETRLIILDTWRAIKPASNGRGSAYDEDATAAAPLLEFAKRRPGLAVLVVHHVRKAEAEDVFDTISGTHGLTGIFDTLMVLARHGKCAKLSAQGRDLDGYEKALERDRRTGGWIVKGDAVALAKTGERQELLDFLANSDRPLSLAELARSAVKRPDAVRHLLKSLIEEGSVYQPRHGQYVRTSPQLSQHTQSDEDQSF